MIHVGDCDIVFVVVKYVRPIRETVPPVEVQRHGMIKAVTSFGFQRNNRD